MHNWTHALLQSTLTFFRLSTQATHLHISSWFTCTSILFVCLFSSHCAHCQFSYKPICFPWKSYIASPQRCSLVHVPPDLTLVHLFTGPLVSCSCCYSRNQTGLVGALMRPWGTLPNCSPTPDLSIPGPPQAQMGTSRNLPL